jgi:hypothetical protein
MTPTDGHMDQVWAEADGWRKKYDEARAEIKAERLRLATLEATDGTGRRSYAVSCRSGIPTDEQIERAAEAVHKAYGGPTAHRPVWECEGCLPAAKAALSAVVPELNAEVERLRGRVRELEAAIDNHRMAD